MMRPMHYFPFFPLQVVSMLEQTNKEMKSRICWKRIENYLDGWGAANYVYTQRGGIESYWKSPEDQETTYQAKLLSAEMSRKRYLQIRECLRADQSESMM